MSQPFADSFIDYLQSMTEDRGKMAILRKGLIENQSHATWILLGRFLNFDNPYQIKSLQTIAGLFAHHPETTEKGNFGSICRQMLDPEEIQKISQGESGPITGHFQYVLSADGMEIFPRIRRLILRAKKDRIPVNYVRLTLDLLSWKSPYGKDRVRLSWGKEFWKMNTESSGEKKQDKGDAHD